MGLQTKTISGKEYYYFVLSYYIYNKSKNFNKYIGRKKPSSNKLKQVETKFKNEIISKLYKKKYSNKLISKDDLIKVALFRDKFNKTYKSLSPIKRKKYDVDSTIKFTLTTLTTEDVDVDLKDVVNASKKRTANLSTGEAISKNMLDGIDFIRKKNTLDEKYLLKLHKIIMSKFETKTPGKFRERQVYLYKHDKEGVKVEINYRPPNHKQMLKQLKEQIKWYNTIDLNPLEKAFVAHTELYMTHPFLDGNKRICRLILNKTLIDNDFPLLNISTEREEYFDSLIKSTETGKHKAFVEFALQKYLQQVKEFLKKNKKISI